MADVTITGLPNASALSGTERVPMDQAGTTVDAAASAIAALATKATVGLANVDNTSDLNKPVSTATQTALDGKVPLGGALGTPSSATLTNATGLPLANGVTGLLPVANGGTGTPTPSLVAGANVTITGSWPNQTIAAAGGGGGGGSHGTVTSVGLSAPTGFVVADSPITTSGTLALSFAAGYSLPTTAKQTEWDTDVIVIPVGDETTALTTGTNKVRFRMPYAATLLAVRSNVNTAPTGSTLIVDVNEAGTSVLGTKLSIDATETSSTTAASAATITDTSLADDAEISIDIDQIGSTVAGAGLKVSLFVRRT